VFLILLYQVSLRQEPIVLVLSVKPTASEVCSYTRYRISPGLKALATCGRLCSDSTASWSLSFTCAVAVFDFLCLHLY
jgi:hypothetical protein